MTPLAMYLIKQTITRPKDREHIWVDKTNSEMLRTALFDIHCFEVSGCLPMFADLASKINEDNSDDLFSKLAFLPAPKTWIEWRHPVGARISILLEQHGDKRARATFFCKEMACNLGFISCIGDDYEDAGGKNRFLPTFITDLGGDKSIPALLGTAHIMLLLINSPHIIGRKQHMPHVGLEKKLVHNFGVGKFPLLAWTEIILNIAKPVEIDDGEPHEAHLTGKRALHFCRKHIRIRFGKLEYVSAHWRGDPALGIKQSRYIVTE